MTDSTVSIPGYRIERELGRGGMAMVYLAQQESLNRPVALKVMNPALATDTGFRQRFLNEGRIVGQLSHSHIVTVFDIGSHGHHYYLSMEYLPGGSLREHIRRGLAPDRVLEIARQLAPALDYAHRRGFIHRDVKPLNVLFREDGSPVLTDFGIAKIVGAELQLTQTGYVLGSAGYMSPEQALGKPIDQRADIYSFGVMLWEMLTGSPLYEAADAFSLALKHATSPIPRLSTELVRYQPLIEKLLAKQPEDRFDRLADFLTALQTLTTTPGDATVVLDRTVVRPPPTVARSAAPARPAPERPVAVATGLGLAEREQRRLVARLPDLIEALRDTDPAAAGDSLATCHALLAAVAEVTDDLLQRLAGQTLAADQRDRLHSALDRQARLDACTEQLQEFGSLILAPAEGASLQALKTNMMEGLDAILLILRDAMQDQDSAALALAQTITGDRSELMQNVRQSYLTDDTRALGPRDKKALLQLTGQFERLIWTLGGLVRCLEPALH